MGANFHRDISNDPNAISKWTRDYLKSIGREIIRCARCRVLRIAIVGAKICARCWRALGVAR